MSIWRQPTTIEQINARSLSTVNGVLGVRITEIGPDFLRGEMPVDERHVQPFGVVHGGVSVVLAETLGSLASSMCCPAGFHAVGLEVNANHLRPVPKGDMLRGHCTPVRVGRTVQVWNIELRRGDGELSCVARLTTAVVETRSAG
jgi:1,4-dihydroxy-2-naphthoyl-CoA hydrolase